MDHPLVFIIMINDIPGSSEQLISEEIALKAIYYR